MAGARDPENFQAIVLENMMNNHDIFKMNYGYSPPNENVKLLPNECLNFDKQFIIEATALLSKEHCRGMWTESMNFDDGCRMLIFEMEAQQDISSTLILLIYKSLFRDNFKRSRLVIAKKVVKPYCFVLNFMVYYFTASVVIDVPVFLECKVESVLRFDTNENKSNSLSKTEGLSLEKNSLSKSAFVTFEKPKQVQQWPLWDRITNLISRKRSADDKIPSLEEFGNEEAHQKNKKQKLEPVKTGTD